MVPANPNYKGGQNRNHQQRNFDGPRNNYKGYPKKKRYNQVFDDGDGKKTEQENGRDGLKEN